MSDEPEGLLKDFDAISPKKRLAKIGGEEVDVTIFSTRATLKLLEYSQKNKFMEARRPGDLPDFSPEQFEGIAEVVAVACQRSNKTITTDWLMDNTDPVTLIEFVKYVIGPITERLKTLSNKKPTGSPGNDAPKNG